MDKKYKNLLILSPIIISLVFIIGIFTGSILNRGKVHERLLIYPKTDKLNNVLNYIQQEYVDSVSKEKIVEDIIPVILENLDPHSIYIPAKELQRYNEPLEGNFSGIGVQFNMTNDTVAIIQTLPNGPSELVGILPGDRIIKVDGDTVAGVNMPTDSIVSKLRGPKGTMVDVDIYRKGIDELLSFQIIRDNIPLYSVDVAYMMDNATGYIKISKFSRTTYEEFMAAIDTLNKHSFRNLILDLRGNGGGYMDAATRIANEFLHEHELIVYTEGRAKPRKNVYSTTKGSCVDINLIILMDEWSASASEILAGAIQDNDRGIILGRRSFGKGLVQEQTVFSDGSALRLTIARYYTPSGRCIQRSYENGNSDYYNEIAQRIQNGELYHLDTASADTSIKYKTKEGHIVYGGGGIYPDIFISLDTTEITPYLMNIRNKGLIYRFAFDYTDSHRELLSSFKNYHELVEYLQTKNLLGEFTEFAAEKGVPPNRNDIKISSDIIKTQILAYISRNLFDNSGFYPILQNIDNTLQAAIKHFEQKK